MVACVTNPRLLFQTRIPNTFTLFGLKVLAVWRVHFPKTALLHDAHPAADLLNLPQPGGNDDHGLALVVLGIWARSWRSSVALRESRLVMGSSSSKMSG